jgi:acyl carrier protein
MDKRENVLAAIYGAVDEVNEARAPGEQLEKTPETVLFGRAAKLDSLGLVTLIVAAEQRIEETFGVTLTLADEHALSQRHSPFRSIGSLADYALTRLP